ncbi:hypothetical protein DPEC_G00095740 [Dallia pectoralis]|uniref:Uncharacterized protein n=1 Tax=Dallia pectoralis TaxID=75939 RepID=A0ACC2GV39_DALPE|nr:hypothetical protein DPEC_G00095740 [Dallia pectoralis]
MMSGELIYSNLIFSETQKQSPGKKDDISKAVTEREEDVTYSDIRTGANLQVHAGKVGSKVVTSERASQRVALVCLVCLCVLLLILTITLGVLYLFAQMDNSTELQNYKRNLNEVNKLLENATAKEDLLSIQLKMYKLNVTGTNELLGNVTAQKDLLSRELLNYQRNLTEVNQLLANATGSGT